MRPILALLLTIAVPLVAGAQIRMPDRAEFPAMAPIGVGLPSILSPLTPIGLPLAPFGPRPDVQKAPPRGGQPQRHAPSRFDRPKDSFQRPATAIFFVPYPFVTDIFAPVQSPMPGYVASPPPPPPPPPPAAPVRARATGLLQLDLEGAGRATQVYVDGYFVGTMGDLSGQLSLESGPHQIEVREHGYEPLVFDVKLGDDRPITYRGELTPLSVPEPTQPASKPTTIYFIPGCYLGNVAPTKLSLPANCDLSRLSTYRP
ncbi:MAG: hypothetical protein ACRD2N_20290 [Vicinamibacterales bacterium]